MIVIAAPAHSPAQPPDMVTVKLSGGWAGEWAGTERERNS